MDRKEAIDVIKKNYPSENYTMLREALDMSIKSLEKEEGSPSASDNSHCTPCQHAFYLINFSGKVRCNKCEAEFPVISTC